MTELVSQLETVACDLCGRDNCAPVFTVRDYIYGLPGEFSLVRCQHCGLLYLNPRPTRQSIGKYYPDLDYHAFQTPPAWKAAILSRMRTAEAKALLRDAPAEPRVLEIGCATGELLVTLRAMGAQVSGIETNGAAVQVAREQHKLDVQIGMLDEVRLMPVQYDLVLMKYALEHVHDPQATMHTIGELLKPGGRAVFWVPNARSWDARLFGPYWRGLDAPRHLYIFTPETMQRMAESAGLSIRAIDFSSVPNDWAGSCEFWLTARHLPRQLVRLFGVDNPIALAVWFPISKIAAAARAAGRMRVVVQR